MEEGGVSGSTAAAVPICTTRAVEHTGFRVSVSFVFQW